MRKLFLLPVLFYLVLTSCKEEEGNPVPAETINQQIKGSWVTVLQKHEYYNQAGQLVHEETDKTESVFTFDGGNVTATYNSGGGISGTYVITRSNGKDYINILCLYEIP